MFPVKVAMDAIIRLTFSFRQIHHLNSPSNVFALWYDNVVQELQKKESLEPPARIVCLASHSKKAQIKCQIKRLKPG